MIELHPVTLADKSWIDPLVWAEGNSSADFNFGNIYLWDNSFHQQVGRIHDHVIVMPCYDNQSFYAMPVGRGDVGPVLKLLRDDCREHGRPLYLRGVTAEHLPVLRALYGEHMTVTDERPVWDYLYSAEKLATLSGKHLHGKRNHINRFETENSWHYEKLTAKAFPACMQLLQAWNETHPPEEGEDADEFDAICRAFHDFEPLGLEGGILYVSDKPVAFTVGEPVCAHTFVVHFEKAFADINGAYPMINREFVRQIRAEHPAIEWINREDDMGLEDLRQSKMSYHPDRMVEKYSVVITDE